MSTQIAPTVDFSCLELVRLLDVFPDIAGGPNQHTITISFNANGTPIVSNKQLTIKYGDTVQWECSSEFRLRFQPGQGPGGPNGSLQFSSTFNATLPANAAHAKGLAFASNDWSSNDWPNNQVQLDYDIEVRVGRKWVKADPSVIIDITYAAYFILRLKEGCSIADVGGVMNMAKPLSSNAKKPSKSSAAARSTGKRSSARRK